MSPITLDTPSTAESTRIYRGRTIEELLPKIQAELGADAVVVRREKGLTGGFAGFFQRPFVEIEARRGTPTPVVDCYDDGGGEPALPDVPPPADDSIAEEDRFRDLLPAVLQDDGPFAAALAEAEAAIAPAQPKTPAAAVAAAGRTRAAIERTLLHTGMSEAFVSELIEGAAAHVMPLMPGRPSLARAVHAALVQRIPACAPLPAGGAAIAVVGTGGAGKSAVCAALLDAYDRRGTLPAAAASLDAALTAPERAALAQARAQGVVVLDTPALSPADPAAIRVLAAALGELAPDRVLLALPATLGARPAAQLLQALAPLNVDALAITHLDETDQLGVAVQGACAFNLAPAYLLRRPERARVGVAVTLTPTGPGDLAERLLPPR